MKDEAGLVRVIRAGSAKRLERHSVKSCGRIKVAGVVRFVGVADVLVASTPLSPLRSRAMLLKECLVMWQINVMCFGQNSTNSTQHYLFLAVIQFRIRGRLSALVARSWAVAANSSG